MTRPTYSELDGALSHLTSTIISTLHVDICDEDEETAYLLPAEPEPIVCDSIAEVVKEFYELSNREMLKLEAAEAENLRVRGLLQRTVRALKYYDSHQTSEAMALLRDTIMASELDAATSGAESADIGKLDTADKKGCTICGKSFHRNPEICFDCEHAGSAETGGEKADLERRIVDLSLKAWEYGAYIGDWEPIQAQIWRAEADEIEKELYAHIAGLASERGLKHKHFPNFHRTSQNQTVSSGVEGAHEGTTADKSGSKEPEKHQHVCEFYVAHYGQHQCACGLRTTMHMSVDDKCAREPEKLYRCKNSDNLHAVMGVPCPDCKLEPEKLNNAPFDRTDDWEARQDAGRQVPNVAESSLSPPPRKLPVGKGLWEVPHFGCDYPQGGCDCYEGEASPELLPTQLPKEK